MSAQPAPGQTGIAAPLQQRLSEQLESLSQVGELLTLRLLELEERLEGLERQVAQLPVGLEPDSADTGSLLAVTDERISRLEELLSGGGQRLHVVPEPEDQPAVEPVAATLDQGENTGFDEPELALHPFPEEDEEQPFMDELSA